MDSYSLDQIGVFVNKCKEWDELDDDRFELESGEKVLIKKMKKIFDAEEEHYISVTNTFVDGKLLEQQSYLKRGCSMAPGSYGNIKNTEKEETIMKNIRNYKSDRKRANELLPLLEVIFSNDYKYTSHVSDPLFTLTVNDMVSFGDFKDAQKTEPQKAVVSGTIVGFINTVRPFYSGKYLLSVICPFEGCDPLVLYHHEKIDPVKVVNQILLMCEDFCEYHRDVLNSINRYDWCHFRNWGTSESDEEDDEDEDDESSSDEDGYYYESNDLTNSTTEDDEDKYDESSSDEDGDYYESNDLINSTTEEKGQSEIELQKELTNTTEEKGQEEIKLLKELTITTTENNAAPEIDLHITEKKDQAEIELRKELTNTTTEEKGQEEIKLLKELTITTTENNAAPEIDLRKEGNMIYFCDTGKAALLNELVLHGKVKQSAIIPDVYSICDDNIPIALSINMTPYCPGDWLFGKAFQDKSTQKYFTLVVHSGFLGDLEGYIPRSVKERYPDLMFSSLKETKLEFNISDFYT